MSKVAAQLGKEGDATPFIDLSYQKISDMLHQCGYQQRGWETMYNGHTGRQLKVAFPPMACLEWKPISYFMLRATPCWRHYAKGSLVGLKPGLVISKDKHLECHSHLHLYTSLQDLPRFQGLRYSS